MNFYDRDKLLEIYNIENNKQDDLIKVLDMIERSYMNYTLEFSDFLSPDIYSVIKNVKLKNDFKMMLFGGHDKSERKILAVMPEYYEIEKEDFPLNGIQISYHPKFSKINHRDVLGSLMSLGIKRNKIGDIYVFKGYTHVLILDDILSYINIRLKKIRNQGIDIEKIPFDNIEYKQPEFKTYNITLNTNRLDTVISRGFNMSRNESKKAVNLNNVKVNHQLVDTHHIELNEGDLISVKGKGRMIFSKINGMSKRDRLKVTLKIYK